MALFIRIAGKQSSQRGAGGAVPEGFTWHHAHRGTPEVWLLQDRSPGVPGCKQDMALPSWKNLCQKNTAWSQVPAGNKGCRALISTGWGKFFRRFKRICCMRQEKWAGADAQEHREEIPR